MDFQALGRYLRETREAQERTLDEAEGALRIRRRILEAFELGEFQLSELSEVQVRGFVRNYARFLGLDDERLVGYYEAAKLESSLPPRQRRSTKTRPVPVPMAPRSLTDTNPSLPPVVLPDLTRPPRPRRSLLATLSFFLVGLAAIAVIVFVVTQLIGTPTPTAPEDATPTEDALAFVLSTAPGLTFVPTITPAGLVRPTEMVVQNYSGQGVLVTVRLSQRAWLRVTSDGQEVYVGIAPPDTLLEFSAANEVLLTSSNAAALLVAWNGRQQGVFGARGQKVDVTFTLSEVKISSAPGFEATAVETPTPFPTADLGIGATIAALTPSSTPGPSPTPTPTLSETPTISPTPTITLTPTLSPTPTITPSLTLTPTITRTPTLTLTPSITPTPSPTAVLPIRATEPGLLPTKTLVFTPGQ